MSSPEKASSTEVSAEKHSLVVHQPAKMEALIQDLVTIENLSQRVSEQSGEDRSGDMGAAGGMARSGAKTAQQSARDQAIATIPAPAVVQKELQAHIRAEVKKLNAQAQQIAHLGQPGAAYRLNELYAKIRRLNSLLGEILEASYEVLKRLFIRVFIDRQPIL